MRIFFCGINRAGNIFLYTGEAATKFVMKLFLHKQLNDVFFADHDKRPSGLTGIFL